MLKKTIYFPIIILLLFSSCKVNKYNYLYAKHDFVGDSRTEYKNKFPEYTLRAGDLVYVNISTPDPEISKYFNIESSKSDLGNSGIEGRYLDGIELSDSGFIKIPVVGDIFLKGHTIAEAKNKIQQRVNLLVKDAAVKVRFLGFKITFLGEIKSTGVFYFDEDRVSILDALAVAGGTTAYADKRILLIIRKTEEGSKTMLLDISERHLLESDDFYLHPNDVIILQPLRSKTIRMALADYSTIISTVTATVTTLFFIINLSK